MRGSKNPSKAGELMVFLQEPGAGRIGNGVPLTPGGKNGSRRTWVQSKGRDLILKFGQEGTLPQREQAGKDRI